MKRILFVLFAFCMFASCNKEQKQTNTPQVTTENVRYKLFPTENIWNFLKLDTRNGRVWQVQWTMDENSFEGEAELNNRPLVSSDQEKNGRFTLYPTRNVYNFLLVDQISGKIWQVQWSTDSSNRFIVPLGEKYNNQPQ
jgi:hypothetical protein